MCITSGDENDGLTFLEIELVEPVTKLKDVLEDFGVTGGRYDDNVIGV